MRYNPFNIQSSLPTPRIVRKTRVPTVRPPKAERGMRNAEDDSNRKSQSAIRNLQSAEALDRIKNQAPTANDQVVVEGFVARGIAADQVKPRENVFTFRAWLTQGRIVRKGEHGLKIHTMVPIKGKDTVDIVSGQVKPKLRPWVSTVFHISQTDPFPTDGAQPKAIQSVVVPVTFTPVPPPPAPVPAIRNPQPDNVILLPPQPKVNWRLRWAADQHTK